MATWIRSSECGVVQPTCQRIAGRVDRVRRRHRKFTACVKAVGGIVILPISSRACGGNELTKTFAVRAALTITAGTSVEAMRDRPRFRQRRMRDATGQRISGHRSYCARRERGARRHAVTHGVILVVTGSARRLNVGAVLHAFSAVVTSRSVDRRRWSIVPRNVCIDSILWLVGRASSHKREHDR